ncbi:MAG: hypothetical protein IT169_02250 [Bryobacterales bacterium]|nr:hypothetical protein [Bryobacterales bacterium]
MQYEPELTKAAAAIRQLMDAVQPLPAPKPSLTVVGTGIRAVSQLTLEAVAAMAGADALLHVIGEPIQEEALLAINPNAKTMTDLYADGLERSFTYEAMILEIMAELEKGNRTVAAFYGHPGVFTYPSHESVRRARAAGFPARMLPGISAADCLYADLGIDPGEGCQAYEATSFLLHLPPVDPSAHLLLWQVGTIGNWTYESAGYDLSSFPVLVDALARIYGPTHLATLYEAPFDPRGNARAERMPIAHLPLAYLTPATTLLIPPVG